MPEKPAKTDRNIAFVKQLNVEELKSIKDTKKIVYRFFTYALWRSECRDCYLLLIKIRITSI